MAATPALASEGPTIPPPRPPAPVFRVVAPAQFVPFPVPAPAAAAPAGARVSSARLVPRTVKRGRRATLKLTLTAPSPVRIVVSHVVRGKRVRVATIDLPTGRSAISRRLPARSGGRLLRTGRYRVTVASIDAQGKRSSIRMRKLVVRAARR
jgi:hypothetical protein